MGAIAKAMVGGCTSPVGTRIPHCPDCNVPVLFNGCFECGHIFANVTWHDLPAWDAHAKAKLQVENRHRQAARLLAEQVREGAALLARVRAALELEEAKGCAQDQVKVALVAELPPPPPALPRCGPKCTVRHRGPCRVCNDDARAHRGHRCPEGGRGSWLLIPEASDLLRPSG